MKKITLMMMVFLTLTTSQAFAGSGQTIVGGGRGFSGDGGAAIKAKIHGPTTLVSDRKGGYYFTDSWNNRIRQIDKKGNIKTVVGSGKAVCGDNLPPLMTCLSLPHGVSLEKDGRLIITDTFNNRILRLDRDNIVRTIAGSGRNCQDDKTELCGEGKRPLLADLHWPTIARRIGKDLYISDSANRILAVRKNRMVRVAGTGKWGFSGDGGPATSAQLFAPADMIAYKGGLLISDGNNCRVRFVKKGIISTFAGGGNISECWQAYGLVKNWYDGWSGPLREVGDGGPATLGRLLVSGFLATDNQRVWVTDFLNNRVRQIDNGIITTVLGTGQIKGTNGNGPMPGETMRLGWPSCVTRIGNKLIVTDSGNDRIITLNLP